jgi:hypothetical protein
MQQQLGAAAAAEAAAAARHIPGAPHSKCIALQVFIADCMTVVMSAWCWLHPTLKQYAGGCAV